MNGLEQRVRHLAVAEIQRQLDDLTPVVEALVTRYDALLAASRDTFTQLERSVGQLQAEVERLQDEIDRFTRLRFWQKVWWLVIGRLPKDEYDVLTRRGSSR